MGFTETLEWLSVYWTTILAIIVFIVLFCVSGYACRMCIFGVPYEHVRNPIHNRYRDRTIHPVITDEDVTQV